MPKIATNSFRKVTHCVFDMDGLLLDTEPIYEEIISQIAGACGKEYTLEVRMKVLGTTEQRSARIAIEGLQLPITYDEYMEQYTTKCREMLGDSRLIKGAARLLRHLHAHKVPMALATSSGKEMFDLKTTNHRELFSLFHHHVYGSSDPAVKESKPAPDIFLVAAERFPRPIEPAMCLVFEDAPNGVRAAHDASMQSVMVPDVSVPADLCSKATLVLKSLEDFKPECFGLPPFEC